MKKKVLISGLLLFLLSSCSYTSSKKAKLPMEDDYTDVCSYGELNLHDYDTSTYGKNVLPIGYSGPYPDSGIYEFGGKAGDPKASSCPPIDFCLTKTGGMTILFTLAFQNNPINFPTNSLIKKLGFEISYQNADGEEVQETYLKEVDRLSEMMNPSISDYYMGGGYSRSNLFVYTPVNCLGLSFKMYPDEKLNYLRFIYSDHPKDIVNAAIFIEKGDIKTSILSKYTGSDCSRLSYTKKLGTHYEFDIISQYGKVYSKDYLLSAFIVKDEYDNTQDHATLISDPDDYFTKGHKAPLDSKFDVTIYAYDSSGNYSDIIFHFIVKDQIGPTIALRNEESISLSYAVPLDDDFISKYFFVVDNFDEKCDVLLVDDNDDEIDNLKLGTIEAKLIATDSFGNQSQLSFTMERYDDVPPLIDCEHDELVLSPKTIMTSENILAFFSSYDEIDGERDVEIIENTYSSNSKSIGNYEVVVSSKDSSGNEARRTLKIYVEDEEGPVFFAKGSFMTFIEGQIPSQGEIVQSLVRQEVIPDKNYVSVNLMDGVEISENLTIGEYESSLQFVADDGSSEFVDLTFEVVSKDTMAVEEVEQEERKSWWASFCQWWIDLFKAIFDFFFGNF